MTDHHLHQQEQSVIVNSKQRDFTMNVYDGLCHTVMRSNYQSLTIHDYLSKIEAQSLLSEQLILIRHDVDIFPQQALKLARIENQYNLKATYYFRTIDSVFDEDIIKAIADLGHEIGYHYETLGQANGNIDQAIELFHQELARLRKLALVTTASMHGGPLKPWDNRDIWQHISPADFDLIGEAYLDIDYTNLVYLNDTGRTWHPNRYNLRDHTEVEHNVDIDSTFDLISLIQSESIPRLCISAHPERWHENPLMWTVQAVRDVFVNSAKMVIKNMRT